MSTRKATCKLFHVSLWVFSMALFTGCDRCNTAISVDGVSLDPSHRILNWMDVLASMPEDAPRSVQLAHFMEADSSFWIEWSEAILQLGPARDTSTVDVLQRFMQEMEPMMLAIDSTSGTSGTLERESAALLDGLKRLSIVDPATRIPNVIWMPSGFNFAVYPGDGWVGIGVDWFLGPSHPLLQQLPPAKFPAYRLARMRHDWMASEALKGWLLVEHQRQIPPSTRAVDLWLYWGKIMHLSAKCMPDVSPAQWMNWTEEEWAWAVENERSAWGEMKPQARLFSDTPREVMRWFQEGPFTKAGRIPQESPDRLGIFLGWRAVEAAMEAHPEWTTQDLLKLQDPTEVLQAYRP